MTIQRGGEAKTVPSLNKDKTWHDSIISYKFARFLLWTVAVLQVFRESFDHVNAVLIAAERVHAGGACDQLVTRSTASNWYERRTLRRNNEINIGACSRRETQALLLRLNSKQKQIWNKSWRQNDVTLWRVYSCEEQVAPCFAGDLFKDGEPDALIWGAAICPMRPCLLSKGEISDSDLSCKSCWCERETKAVQATSKTHTNSVRTAGVSTRHQNTRKILKPMGL